VEFLASYGKLMQEQEEVLTS